MLIAVAALIGSAALSKVGSDSPGIGAAALSKVGSDSPGIGAAALSKVGSDSPGIGAAIVDDVSSTGVHWSHQASSCSQVQDGGLFSGFIRV
ncbi:hypothetical protein TNCV_4674311 [Trichonephila clavipes]|nr:hypothetical protein TNCV_4674311 [Trichonephila clavipes]